MKNRISIISSILYLLVASSLSAQVNVLKLTLKNASQHCVLLKEHPYITFSSDSLRAQTKNWSVNIAQTDLDYYSFAETDLSSLEENSLSPMYYADHDTFWLKNLSTKVVVTDVFGRTVTIPSTMDYGWEKLDFKSTSPGLYLIQNGEMTIKFLKK
jgi:hypothetical protein